MIKFSEYTRHRMTVADTAICHYHSKVNNEDEENSSFKHRFTWYVPCEVLDTRRALAKAVHAAITIGLENVPNPHSPSMISMDNPSHALQ